MKNKILRIEASILVTLILTSIFSVVSFSQECDGIREKMLRMHVIANSDSDDDQALKLKVRDEVLSYGKELFDGSVTADQAKEKISPHIKEIEEVALNVIRREGYDYTVKVTVENEYFDTRIYDGSVTLPAGIYTAVKVIIGEGKGKNWWCVMFPPMCLPAATAECELSDVLNSKETDIVTNNKKYKVRFKLVEIYERYIKS